MNRFAFLVCGALLAALPLGGSAAPAGIHVTSVWSRPAVETGAIYFTIINRGTKADRLVAAQSDAAQSTQIHHTSMHNGIMTMAPVPYVEVPAGASVRFQPGGYHVMLVGLKHDLKAGQKIRCRLRFERAGWITVESTVRPM